MAAELLRRDAADYADAGASSPSTQGIPLDADPDAGLESEALSRDEQEGIDIPTGLDEGEGDDDGEGDGDGDEPESDADRAPGDWPDSARKRVGKLTAQKKELAANLEQARAEAEELRQQLQARAAEAAEVPLPQIRNWDELQHHADAARGALEWLIKNPYGGEYQTSDGQTRSLTAEEVAERRIAVERVLNVQVPQRAQYLQQLAAANQEAAKHYPQLFQDNTPQSRMAHAIAQQYPEITRYPEHVMLVGDLMIGRAVREGRAVLVPKGQAANPAKKSAAVRPPMVPSPGGSGTVPRKGQVQTTNGATERFLATGEVTDLAKVIEARL